MADTTSLVKAKRFRVSNTMDAEMQVWYRSLNVGTLKGLRTVSKGDFVWMIVLYTAT